MVVPGLPCRVMPGSTSSESPGHPFLHFPEELYSPFTPRRFWSVSTCGTVLSRIPSVDPALSPVSSMLLADRDLLNKMEAVDKLPEADKATIKADAGFLYSQEPFSAACPYRQTRPPHVEPTPLQPQTLKQRSPGISQHLPTTPTSTRIMYRLYVVDKIRKEP